MVVRAGTAQIRIAEPRAVDLWTDIYYKGTEPPRMRGREREEVSWIFFGMIFFAILLFFFSLQERCC